MTQAAQGSAKQVDWLLITVLAISLTGNAVQGGLAYRDHLLQKEAVRQKAGLQVGDRLESLELKTLGGEFTRLSWQRERGSTVIYVSKSSCVWCARNEANVRALATGIGDSRLLILALDTDQQAAVSSFDRIGVPQVEAFYDPSRETLNQLILGSTPTTIVVSPDGRVQNIWRGAFVAATAEEIERTFSIGLPGLLTLPSKP